MDATARLYDVDEDSVVFRKLDKTEKYDQGSITFHARGGHLIDLDQLHESLWATRLSGGTRSGLISLEVTAVGRLTVGPNQTELEVSDSDTRFILQPDTDAEHAGVWAELRERAANRQVKLTGRIDGYSGYWPDVLRQVPTKPRRILVTQYELLESP